MNPEHLNEALTVAGLLGTRMQLVIPSILAEGEPFRLRLSVTGSDALPLRSNNPITLIFEESNGIDGLPSSFTFEPGTTTGDIEGLTATGPETASVRATVQSDVERGQMKHVVSNPA